MVCVRWCAEPGGFGAQGEGREDMPPLKCYPSAGPVLKEVSLMGGHGKNERRAGVISRAMRGVAPVRTHSDAKKR